MNNSFSFQQKSKTGNLDSKLISRHYEKKLMARFMQINFENPKLKQSEKAGYLGYSSFTLQSYRNDIYAYTIWNSAKYHQKTNEKGLKYKYQ